MNLKLHAHNCSEVTVLVTLSMAIVWHQGVCYNQFYLNSVMQVCFK